MSQTPAFLGVQSVLGGNLNRVLMSEDIEPGSDPSYELCKLIYLYHPLGAKMAEAPVNLVQSQKRKRTVQKAVPEVMDEFEAEWRRLHADVFIHNTARLSRIYGIANLAIGVRGDDNSKPLDVAELWKADIYFNVYDPLNSAGSQVLNQIPTSPDFNKPVTLRTMGETFHPTRFQNLMNGQPIYLGWTSSAFGFVGRSVYQSALYPLKSFIRTMQADDMIAMKLALLIAKMKRPGPIVDAVMQGAAAVKRWFLKLAQNGNVLSIDPDEEIETLNMQNVDGAGKYARTNIIKNIATAADMPAVILENETLTEGFGEGTEDAKNIARYIQRQRESYENIYAFMERICMHRAWTPAFYERLHNLFPDQYPVDGFAEARSDWMHTFKAEWPSFLIEPESEAIKTEQVKLEAIVSLIETIGKDLDPENKLAFYQWAIDNVCENKHIFPHGFDLDQDLLGEFLKEKAAKEDAAAEAPETGLADKVGKQLA